MLDPFGPMSSFNLIKARPLTLACTPPPAPLQLPFGHARWAPVTPVRASYFSPARPCTVPPPHSTP